MSSSEEILEQIDTAVRDWTVSGDAMRSRPNPVPTVPVVPYTGRDAARALLVRRLVDNHDLREDQAAAAVHAAEHGEEHEHLELVSAEARAAVAERAQELGRVVTDFMRALRPMAEAAAATLRQFAEALRTAGFTTPDNKPARRRDRPAWQSPYGPPPRRKR
ncbi:hypothetical protein ACWC1C_07585 [Streptomyces sp. NPDC001705]